VTVSSISVNVPNPVEWTQVYSDKSFASGHAYLIVKVPINAVSTTITTCTTETATSIIDTHIRISFRCPSASTYIEGNEYLIDSNDDTNAGSYCSTVVAGSEAASNTIYAVVQAGKFAPKDINERQFGAIVKFGCSCGWSGAFCDIPAISLTLNLPTVAVFGNAFNFSWTINKATAGAMTALTYSKTGEEYVPLLLEVDEHTSCVFVTTCTMVTQENVRNALIYTASSNPPLFPNALDGATQAVCNGVSALGSNSRSDLKGDAFCTPWEKLSYSRSLHGYQLLVVANGRSFDSSSSGIFGISTRIQCDCDWGDGVSSGCSAPFGVRVGCTDTRKNIAGAALCSASGRLTFPSTWPNVFGFSDSSTIYKDEPAAVITLTLSDNAEGTLPSSVMISTLDPVTSDPTTGLVKTSLWVYKGCARGGVPLQEQTWTLVANSNGTGVIQDSSTVTLSNPTDRVYYVVVKGRQNSANAGKMKQFGLTWTQILPTPTSPAPSSPTHSSPTPSSLKPSPSSLPSYSVQITSIQPTISPSPQASLKKTATIVPSINNGPTDASFYLGGSQNDDLLEFSKTMSNFSGITYYSNLQTYPSSALVFSSGSYLSNQSTSLPSGSSPFTVSAWVKCNMPTDLTGLNGGSSSSSNSNRSFVAVSWGEVRSSLDNSSFDSVILSVNKVSTQATVTTLVGRGFGQFIDDGGNSPIYFPQRIIADSRGNVFDYSSNRIRKVDSNGKVTHFVGNGNDGSVDGTGTDASFSNCRGIAIDYSDNIYFLQSPETLSTVRKISPKGVVKTVYQATFPGIVSALTVDPFGNMYFSLVMSANGVHKVSPSGQTTIFGKTSGNSYMGSFADGFGTDASFNTPQSLANDEDGNVYVADYNNFRVRKISLSNNYVSTLAGNGNSGVVDGNRFEASFNSIYHIAADSKGNVFVADNSYSISINYIRKITPNGDVSTIAGSGYGHLDGIGTNALFSSINGFAVGSKS
jgi:hypothetical protein